jgi:putative phosphoribosyl transferase
MLTEALVPTGMSPANYVEGLEDRIQVGRKLAMLLQPYRSARALVLGLPPGGVAVAEGLSQALRLPLDVLVAREFALPPYPMLTVGALSEGAGLCLNAAVLRMPGMLWADMWEEARQVQQELAALIDLYRGGRPLPLIERRSIILVDDGIRTGLLQLATLAALRHGHVRQCIVVTAGGSEAAIRRVAGAADTLIHAGGDRPPEPAQWRRPVTDEQAAALFHTCQPGS